MDIKKPLCTVPFATGFTTAKSTFRECCVSDPQINSNLGATFEEWQQDSRLVAFKKSLYADQLPSSCHRCVTQERIEGSSFRTAVNQQAGNTDLSWPSRWNITFGNVCNIGCWSCSEYSSSVIHQHKKKLGILDQSFVNPNQQFAQMWPGLKASILRSYSVHSSVTLTLLGGEPLYNRVVLEFLDELIQLGLSNRTRIEIHTNGTIDTELLNKDQWEFVCVFISIDAVGKLAEWVRYGSNWKTIERNLIAIKASAHYVEVHAVLSILNIARYNDLKEYCDRYRLPLQATLVTDPGFMDIAHYDEDPVLLLPSDHEYYEIIGSKSQAGTMEKLREYVRSFDKIRKPLADFDADLAKSLNL